MPEPASPAELNASRAKHTWDVATLVACFSALITLADHLVTRRALEHEGGVSRALRARVHPTLVLEQRDERDVLLRYVHFFDPVGFDCVEKNRFNSLVAGNELLLHHLKDEVELFLVRFL